MAVILLGAGIDRETIDRRGNDYVIKRFVGTNHI